MELYDDVILFSYSLEIIKGLLAKLNIDKTLNARLSSHQTPKHLLELTYIAAHTVEILVYLVRMSKQFLILHFNIFNLQVT